MPTSETLHAKKAVPNANRPTQRKAVSSPADSLPRAHHRLENATLGSRTPRSEPLPLHIRGPLERRSGLSLEGVQVYRNSAYPAAVQAEAYAQGNNIHLAPGRERYLAHEVWHVVQQKRQRVAPTTSVSGRAVNDSPELEREAEQIAERLPWSTISRTSREHSEPRSGLDSTRQEVSPGQMNSGPLQLGRGKKRKQRGEEKKDSGGKGQSDQETDEEDERQEEEHLRKKPFTTSTERIQPLSSMSLSNQSAEGGDKGGEMEEEGDAQQTSSVSSMIDATPGSVSTTTSKKWTGLEGFHFINKEMREYSAKQRPDFGPGEHVHIDTRDASKRVSSAFANYAHPKYPPKFSYPGKKGDEEELVKDAPGYLTMNTHSYPSKNMEKWFTPKAKELGNRTDLMLMAGPNKNALDFTDYQKRGEDFRSDPEKAARTTSRLIKGSYLEKEGASSKPYQKSNNSLRATAGILQIPENSRLPASLPLGLMAFAGLKKGWFKPQDLFLSKEEMNWAQKSSPGTSWQEKYIDSQEDVKTKKDLLNKIRKNDLKNDEKQRERVEQRKTAQVELASAREKANAGPLSKEAKQDLEAVESVTKRAKNQKVYLPTQMKEISSLLTGTAEDHTDQAKIDETKPEHVSDRLLDVRSLYGNMMEDYFGHFATNIDTINEKRKEAKKSTFSLEKEGWQEDVLRDKFLKHVQK